MEYATPVIILRSIIHWKGFVLRQNGMDSRLWWRKYILCFEGNVQKTAEHNGQQYFLATLSSYPLNSFQFIHAISFVTVVVHALETDHNSTHPQHHLYYLLADLIK